MNIEGVSALANFEVIEIMDDSNSYPVLLGINWAIDMNGGIKLKKCNMSFEKKLLRVIVPLDPIKGVRYTEPVRDYVENNDDLDQIYKIKTRDDDWINPTTNG